ncbi:MAG TPA: response regulator transcription factor [Anaerolineaceae bacterium]|jgi:two-component system KDP operon response regulator KdpE|nr:response regulator transcription factor [Anaerolineaceae bacterium]
MDPSTKKNRILVVDDEKGLVKLIRLNLEQDGFEVVEANNGAEAMEKLRVTLPDLVLLDVMMPDMDGFQVLKMIREIGNTPVIMLTAKGEESDIVRGLELGADDYITKPFSPKILTSRIRAVLRRGSYADETDTGKIDVDGRLQIDFDRHEVWVDGKLVQLRPTEYRLLYHLVKNAGWVLTHDQILNKVWGYEYENEPHYVRLYINYLRKKIEKDPAHPKYILTERGVGYRFVDYKREKLAEKGEQSSQDATQEEAD